MTRSEPVHGGVPAPLRISLLYAAFGVAWILLGDLALWMRGGVTRTALLLELGKGLVFVLVSALLLYILVKREVDRRARAAAQLASVLDTAPVGIVAVDRDDRIRRWNRAATRILGWRETEVVGRTVTELGLRVPEGEEGPLDVAVEARDGGTVDVRLFAGRADAGARGPRVIVIRDHRPQIEIENALRRAHKLEAVGRVAGGIAHEFNNILTAVLGHALLLADYFPERDERRAHAEEVRRSAERAASLTRQLLVFSGKHITTTTPIDLSALLGDLRSVNARVAGDHVTLEYALADDLWPVRCDPAQLNQLVLNLVVNACEAMLAPGTITVQTSNVAITSPRGPDPVPPGEYVLLRVTDTGAGMSADTLAHLFEPFFTTKDQGTGLGLAIVYGIVQQCEGHIRVRSDTRTGSVFDIYFPRAESTEPTPHDAPAFASGGVSLLVVEDDDAVRDLTCRILDRHGHHVLGARNGEEALALLAGGADVRLVIADVVMPGMNGFELARRIHRSLPDLPVLFTSGFVGGADEEGDIEPGPHFLQKPYRPDELVARVDQLLVDAGN